MKIEIENFDYAAFREHKLTYHLTTPALSIDTVGLTQKELAEMKQTVHEMEQFFIQLFHQIDVAALASTE